MFRHIEGMDRVAIYLRKSRADQEAEARGEGETLSKHRKTLMALATGHKIFIRDEDIYEEIVSGEKIAYRPEMQKLLENVEQGKYQAVLCMDLDRLGRGNMIDQGTIQEIFKTSKTLIVTSRKVYDLTNEMDEEWSEFEAFFARRELKTITRRMQRGRVQSIQEGKYIGVHPPFGYDRNDHKILVPNDDAQVVKMLFNWYINGDEEGNPMGSTKIADKLNELGIKSPQRKQDWIPSTVLSILKNEVYIGIIQWKKSFRNKKEGIGHIRDRSEWIEVRGKHVPIIPEEQFQRAQMVLKGHLTPQTRTKRLRNPLAGLIECGGCGHKMVMQTATGIRYAHIPMELRLRMIKCTTPSCSVPSASFKYVEEKLLMGLEKYLNDLVLEKDRIKEGTEFKQADNPYPTLMAETEKELVELEKQIDSLDGLVEQGVYTIEKYTQRAKKLEDEKFKLGEIFKQIRAANELFINQTEQIPKRIETITRVLEGYKKTDDVTIKNKLLKEIVLKAIYDREPNSQKADFRLQINVLQK